MKESNQASVLIHDVLTEEREEAKPMYRSDPALIQACLTGDQRAWDELVERYSRLVYSIPRRYGLSATEADDIFQSVWSIVLRRLEQLQDQTRLSAWLITTTHRECWRQGKMHQRLDELDSSVVDVSRPPTEKVMAWEREQLVRQALQQLGGRCADLLAALFLDPAEPNYEQIAARLQMSVGSIGPTRTRCFKKLEPILVELGLDELM
jgi:RNA polymerase sigma factor (sigma-70 family)